MARQNLTEAGAHTEILEANDDGSFLIQIMTPGWGSSGYYSAEVVEAAAKDKVWPKGTHMYFDHPTTSEASERAERSVKDLAATLAEDARWDSKRVALIGRTVPVGLGKAVLVDEAFRKAVACSVRASAEMSIGEAEGKKGWIVEKIHPGTFNSVDFVTHAGRGGMILEAARQANEATNNDRSQQLSDAVREKYGKDKTWVWVRDFDDTRVWFEVNSDNDASQTYEQTYTVDDGDLSVTLAGARTEVRVRTQYVPVKQAKESAPPNVPVHPAGQSTTTRENTMPENEGATTSIEESKRRELEEAAGRVPVLEAKLASETERANTAEQALAVETAKDYAREFGTKRVREANSELSAPVVEKIVAEAMREIPLTEAEKAADRRLDTEAFGKRVDEARKEQELYLATVIENSGATVRGLGPVSEKQEVTAADSQRAIDEAFGRQSKEG